MLTKSLINIMAKSLVNISVKSLLNLLTKSLVNILAQSLVSMKAKSLLHSLTDSLVNMLTKSMVNMLVRSLVNMLVWPLRHAWIFIWGDVPSTMKVAQLLSNIFKKIVFLLLTLRRQTGCIILWRKFYSYEDVFSCLSGLKNANFLFWSRSKYQTILILRKRCCWINVVLHF